MPRTHPDKYPGYIPLVRECDEQEHPVLFLLIWYKVTLDKYEKYLQVDSSAFHLLTRIKQEKKKKLRPIVRIEYERYGSPPHAESHFHLHANSPELAWIYGSNRQEVPDLHKLHLPAGGRRFRPTLEEFLFFLDREEIFNNWKEGCKKPLRIPSKLGTSSR